MFGTWYYQQGQIWWIKLENAFVLVLIKVLLVLLVYVPILVLLVFVLVVLVLLVYVLVLVLLVVPTITNWLHLLQPTLHRLLLFLMLDLNLNNKRNRLF